ncbi:large ribosomal subunit protein eL39-like [Sminthopsis crassicaudata]|uniref:large ribosomal subunit protein eL39-like n=1 Tax=Sminthopsis crassicaudata TaxID=9301 RepID=UPI003D69B7A5
MVVNFLKFFHKTFKIKRVFTKQQKQNCLIFQGICMKTGNKIKPNPKRRQWKKTKMIL